MFAWEILLEILIILGAALALGTLAEQLRQSAILGYLVAGTLVGPNVLGFVGQGEHVQTIAELGVALLLFTIGLEFSFRRLKSLGRIALLGGTLQVVVTLVIGAVVAAALGLSARASIAVGAMVALSSTACVLRLLTERTAIDSLYGRNALGILLLQDVAVIPLMLLIVILAGGSTLGGAAIMFGQTVLLGGLLVGSFLILFNLVVPRLLSLQRWSRNREFPVLLAIVLALGSAYAAHAASLSPAMGAFLAGVLLGGTPFAPQIRADVGSLRTVLVTLFFTSIGMLGDPAWVIEHWSLVLVVVVLIVVTKTIVVWGIFRLIGSSNGVALATGLVVAQVGEFSFVLAEMARSPEPLISLHVFNLLVSVTILTLFMTPFLVMAAPKAVALLAKQGEGSSGNKGPGERGREGESRSIPCVIIGFGPAGQAAGQALYRHFRDEITVLELNSRTAAAARRFGFHVQLGDATHHDVLEHAGVGRARVIIVTVPDPVTSKAVIHACRDVAPDATIVARSRYHVRRWEIEGAGAGEIVDEEVHVGRRLAAIARRHTRREE